MLKTRSLPAHLPLKAAIVTTQTPLPLLFKHRLAEHTRAQGSTERPADERTSVCGYCYIHGRSEIGIFCKYIKNVQILICGVNRREEQ